MYILYIDMYILDIALIEKEYEKKVLCFNPRLSSRKKLSKRQFFKY